jgi:hypothetical protein
MIKCNTYKRFVLAGVIAVGFTVCLHCGHSREPRNLITGTVTDSLTGAPIDSAQVVIGDTLISMKVFYTNPQGYYTAFLDTFGVVQIFCRKDTYRTKQRTMDLSSNLDVYRDVDFELQPN